MSSEAKKEGSVPDYIQYHQTMIDIGDLDPYFPAMNSYADFYQLDFNDRIKLCFWFSLTYSAPTAMYIHMCDCISKIDDNWWQENKYKLTFGPDRMRVKSNDMFIPAVQAWKEKVKKYSDLRYIFVKSVDPHASYNFACDELSTIPYMGPFALGLMLEGVRFLTGLPLEQKYINWKESQSSRRGLFYVMNVAVPETSTSDYLARVLFKELYEHMSKVCPKQYLDIAKIESTLCIYKNYLRGHRWLGYYIERERQELFKMRENYKEYEETIWNWYLHFRRNQYSHKYLKESLYTLWTIVTHNKRR